MTNVQNGNNIAQDAATVRLLGIQAAPRGIEGTMLYFAKYGRGLSRAEAIEMTTRPWQILAASSLLWAMAAGGARPFHHYQQMRAA